ncbi:hypothetical protein [Kaistella sp.]|uniref:hypothetical protein n=1 Tax=Kaistella sp. TaxID=2782235 RepID=UPI003C4B5D01
MISDIANEKKIPLKFLENILLELKKAEIRDSKKRKGGGYFFGGKSSRGFPCHDYQIGE